MDLDGLGARCSLASCSTLDYLPLRCNHCRQQFCADHHAHAAHACAAAPAASFIPTCPICAQPVPSASGQTPDGAMARHVDAGCPRRARRNKVCAKPDCRARDIAPVLCRACGETFCLEHRLEADHQCEMTDSRKADSPLAAAMLRMHTSGSAPGGGRTNAGDGGRKKSLLSRRTRSKSPRGPATKGVGSTSNATPSLSTKSGGSGAKKLLTTFSNQTSNPKKATGGAAIDPEDSLYLAVYFASQLERRPEYWLVSRRWSAGKVLDKLRLPEQEDGARFSLYAVRRSGEHVTGINLLPRITPLRDNSDLLRNYDAVVVEVGDNGLPPEWVDVVSANRGLQKFKATRADADRSGFRTATKSKCIVV